MPVTHAPIIPDRPRAAVYIQRPRGVVERSHAEDRVAVGAAARRRSRHGGEIMAIERNGVVVFEMDEKPGDHPAFKALEGVNLGDVRFPFGFFLRWEDGKRVVIPATEQERRETILKAFPAILPEALRVSCRATVWHERCQGGCGELPPGYFCVRIYDPRHFFTCGCVDMS
jgi:hypothetical protein